MIMKFMTIPFRDPHFHARSSVSIARRHLTIGSLQGPIAPPPVRKRTSPLRVHHTLPPQPPAQPAAIAFGNFDGVHLGHRALLAQLRQDADRLNGPLIVVTFHPHPLHFLRPDRAPAALDTLEGRLKWLEHFGVDEVVVLRFDAQLAAVPAEIFAREWLCQRLHGRAFAVGPDMHFGHQRRGDAQLLRTIAAETGGTVHLFRGEQVAGDRVSSSRVRHAVADGNLPLATQLLGRPYALRGHVVHGDARGQTLGFPTANLHAPQQVQPQNGIYAGLAKVRGQFHPAAISQGTRPTFAGQDVRTEAFLLDFQGDLYDQPLDLHFLFHLRDELHFADLPSLIAQIDRDVLQTRQMVENWQKQHADFAELLL